MTVRIEMIFLQHGSLTHFARFLGCDRGMLAAVCMLDTGDLSEGLTSVSYQSNRIQLKYLMLETMYNLPSTKLLGST